MKLNWADNGRGKSVVVTHPFRYSRPRDLAGPTGARASRQGFTLTELLVAMAIFVSLMAGITLLFIGSTRTSQQGFQTQEAYEIARGAMNLMQRDLSRAFTSRQHGNFYSFYGTPIGFTFVGVASPRVDGDPNIARVTYVIHPRQSTRIVRDLDENQRPLYDLIRFVEPGVEDLVSFPVDWTTAMDLPVNGANTLQEIIDQAVADAQGLGGLCPDGDPDCLQLVVEATRRELWIRLLSDNESAQFPSLWEDMGLDFQDYVLAENIWDEYLLDDPLLTDPPGFKVFQGIFNPFDIADSEYSGSETLPFFQYSGVAERLDSISGGIEDATTASPIVVTSPRHGLTTDTQITVGGVLVNDPGPPVVLVNSVTNDTWITGNVTDDTFELFEVGTLLPSIGDFPYQSGGRWELSRDIGLATNTDPIVITDIGHGLSTNNLVAISGVRGNLNANGVFDIFRLDENTFTLRTPGTLITVPGSGLHTGGGTWLKTGIVAGASNTTPISIDDNDHGLASGNRIRVTGVDGNLAANGIFTVTRTDDDNFVLDGSVGNGTYSGGGTWIEYVSVETETLPFWNDTRNERGLGTLIDPHLPQVVTTRFTLFFKSPAPGAPDFQRAFDQRIDLPGAYQRFTRN